MMELCENGPKIPKSVASTVLIFCFFFLLIIEHICGATITHVDSPFHLKKDIFESDASISNIFIAQTQ